MNRAPVIVVSQRVDRLPERGEVRDALDQRLSAWLMALGGLPVPVPNVLADRLEDWLESVRPTAVLLAGGNDIGDSAERDHTEAVLINLAARVGLPLLGICRGMQVLAQHAGGQLIPISGHVGTRHALQGIVDDSAALPGTVNSYHNWGIAKCPPEYEVLATAPDGSIEAMRHVLYGWEGWMWHPEREATFGAMELIRARYLLIGDRPG